MSCLCSFQSEDLANITFDYTCQICDAHVNNRTKHCGDCNRCVAVFDHHCKWLNNCIGVLNYNYFMYMISFYLMHSLYSIGVLIALILEWKLSKD